MGYESEQYYARRNEEEAGWSVGMYVFFLIVGIIVVAISWNFWFTDSDREELKKGYNAIVGTETTQVDE